MRNDRQDPEVSTKAPAVRGDTKPTSDPAPSQSARSLGYLNKDSSRPLPFWQRVGFCSAGTVFAVGVLITHAAAVIAVPGLVLGSGLVALGFGLKRELTSFNLSHKGLSGETADKVKEVTEKSAAIVNEAKDLTEVRYALVTSWVDDLQRLLPVLAQPEVPISDALRATVDFVRSRLVDLTQELQSSGETVRAGVWLLSEADQRLHFALGSDATGPWDPFSVGEGIIGRSFLEVKPWNIPDRRKRPEYVKLESNDPFQGLLCLPLTSGSSSPIGVLCIDRTKAEAFPDSSVKLASTLARMITLALMNPKHKKALANIKEPPSLSGGSL